MRRPFRSKISLTLKGRESRRAPDSVRGERIELLVLDSKGSMVASWSTEKKAAQPARVKKNLQGRDERQDAQVTKAGPLRTWFLKNTEKVEGTPMIGSNLQHQQGSQVQIGGTALGVSSEGETPQGWAGSLVRRARVVSSEE